MKLKLKPPEIEKVGEINIAHRKHIVTNLLLKVFSPPPHPDLDPTKYHCYFCPVDQPERKINKFCGDENK